MPKLSFVIPVYKIKEEYLKKCIESICKQTNGDFEAIFVDDGSPDNCGQICEEYTTEDKRIRVIHQENQGVSVARNTGIYAAESDWIAFVDGDDWVEDDFVETVLPYLEKINTDVLVYAANIVSSEKTERSNILSCENETFVSPEMRDYILFQTLGAESHKNLFGMGAPWGKICRKDFLIDKNVLFCPGIRRMQDTLFSLYVYAEAEKIYYIDSALYNYNRNNDSACTRFNSDSTGTFFPLLEEMKKFTAKYPKITKRAKLETAYKKRIVDIVFNCCGVNYGHPDNNKTFKQKKSELNELVNNQMVKNAIKECDYSLFPVKRRIMGYLLKFNMISLFLKLWIKRMKAQEKQLEDGIL